MVEELKPNILSFYYPLLLVLAYDCLKVVNIYHAKFTILH